MRETRTILGGEIRSIGDDGRSFTAKVLTYDATDTYGTQFRAGCFDASIEAKLPRATWSHDWTRPIGKVTAVRDTGDGLEMDFQLADFDSVPDAKMAYSLIQDGIIDGFSVGFEPTDVRDAKGIQVKNSRMMPGDVCWEGNLVEISPVLVPSVPGTKTLAVRSDEPAVSKELVADLLVKFSSGEIDLADALNSLKAEGRSQPEAEPESRSDDPVTGIQAVDAAIDEAIALFSSVDVSTLPEEIAQGIALVNAADSAMDDVMASTGIYDADADVSSNDDPLGYSAAEDTEITAALALIDSRIN